MKKIFSIMPALLLTIAAGAQTLNVKVVIIRHSCFSPSLNKKKNLP